MRLKEKLEQAKKIIVEEYTEHQETLNMTADEYAQRYGYEKILKRVRTDMFLKVSENNSENEDDYNEVQLVSTSLCIKETSQNKIVILDPEFGEKEEYNLTVLTNLFAKDEIKIIINDDDDLKYLVFSKEKTMRSKIEDTIKQVYDNKDEYVKKASDLANKGITAAKETTKKTLRNMADWADTHL